MINKNRFLSLVISTIFLIQLMTASFGNASETEVEESYFINGDTGTIFNIGDTITESCILNGNINCKKSYALIIGKENITIDGNGYTINFIGEAADSEGIHNECFDKVRIKNFTITNFCFGIYFKNVDDAELINNTISYTFGSGIWLEDSSNNIVLDNTVNYGQDGHGLLISTGSEDNLIKNNILTTVNGRGLSIEQSNNNSIYNNLLCGNKRGDLLIENSLGTIGDNNTATNVIAQDYKDQTDGNPCSYSCQTTGVDLEDSDNVLIQNSILITSDYVLSENIVNSEGHGLVVGANNIVIDGNDFVLDGTSPCPCDGAGVQRSGVFNPGFDNVTIKNLEIKNFCNGIYLKGDKISGDYVYENKIDNCEVHHNGCDEGGDTSTHGVKLEYVRACQVVNCSIHDNTGKGDGCENGGNGIFMYGSENNFIYNNLVFDNTKGGIFSKMKSSFNKISFNTVSSNGQGGIILRCKLSRFSVCDNNNIEGNKGPGIYVGGPQNTFSYNTISSNEDGSIYNNDASIPDGIRISREADFTTLISNTISGHENDIWVQEDLKGVYGANNTYNTTENYQESWGMKLEQVNNQVDSNSGLPTLTPTPLMATILVFLAVFIVVGGYMQNSAKNKNKIFNFFKKKK
jgi:parallel beta-helix repeat protein